MVGDSGRSSRTKGQRQSKVITIIIIAHGEKVSKRVVVSYIYMLEENEGKINY